MNNSALIERAWIQHLPNSVLEDHKMRVSEIKTMTRNDKNIALRAKFTQAVSSSSAKNLYFQLAVSRDYEKDGQSSSLSPTICKSRDIFTYRDNS